MGRCCNSSRMRWQVACRSLVWACSESWGIRFQGLDPQRACAPEEADIGNRAPRSAQNYGYALEGPLGGGDLSRLSGDLLATFSSVLRVGCVLCIVCITFLTSVVPDAPTGLHRPNNAREGGSRVHFFITHDNPPAKTSTDRTSRVKENNKTKEPHETKAVVCLLVPTCWNNPVQQCAAEQ
ncbi:hypothetical protein F5Y09DRAFT_257835 [Xylaria sp. FL1042]|nr:hypothetical protein F5Y09DRAFT_257835 [Xylaria sp. FL1042]